MYEIRISNETCQDCGRNPSLKITLMSNPSFGWTFKIRLECLNAIAYESIDSWLAAYPDSNDTGISPWGNDDLIKR